MSLTVECVLLLLMIGRYACQYQGGQSGLPVNLLEYKNENYGADGYEFFYETDDGVSRQEKGSFVEGIWTVIGKSAWRDPNGKFYIAEYTADDRGYNVRLSESFQGPVITVRPYFGYAPGQAYGSAAPASYPVISKEALASLVEHNGILMPPLKGKKVTLKRRPY